MASSTIAAAPSPQRPLMVLIPGSCHSPSMYDSLVTHLSTSGYECTTIPLPSVSPADAFSTSAAADTSAIRHQLSHLVNDLGRDVVLVTHSYAGVPGCGAACGYSKTARRKQGLSGGVLGVVAIAAILVAESETCLQHTGEVVGVWSEADPSTGLVRMKSSEGHSEDTIYYNDLTAEQLVKAHESLAPQAAAPFSTPGPLPAWSEPDYAGRLAYIRCGRDRCMLPELQDSMRTKSRVEWEVIEFAESGHSPMIGMVQETAEVVERLAEKWGVL